MKSRSFQSSTAATTTAEARTTMRLSRLWTKDSVLNSFLSLSTHSPSPLGPPGHVKKTFYPDNLYI